MVLPDLDLHSGFALYWQDKLIGRIYYNRLDHKPFYNIVRENISMEEIEHLIYHHDMFEHKDCVLVDNLTGTRIPNERHRIAGAYITFGYHLLVLRIYWAEPKPRIRVEHPEDSFLMKWCRFLSFYANIAVHNTIDAFWNCCNAVNYTRRASRQLEECVQKHLASQKTAVIDLCRGSYSYWANEKTNVERCIDWKEIDPAVKCLLRKECLAHIESFVLFLPGYGAESETYQKARSNIDPEKVTELLIYEPITLDDFVMYRNIKKLSLLDAEKLETLKGIRQFSKLEHFYIIARKPEIVQLEGWDEIPEHVQMEIAVIDIENCTIKIYTKPTEEDS